MERRSRGCAAAPRSPLGSPTPRVYPPVSFHSPARAGARSEPGEWKGARSPHDLCRRSPHAYRRQQERAYGGEVRPWRQEVTPPTERRLSPPAPVRRCRGGGKGSRGRRVGLRGLGSGSRVRRVCLRGLGVGSRATRVCLRNNGAGSRVSPVGGSGGVTARPARRTRGSGRATRRQVPAGTMTAERGRRAGGFGRETGRSLRVPGGSIVMIGWGTVRSWGASDPWIVRCGNGIGRSARPGRPIGVAIARPAISYGPGGAGARSVPGNAGRPPGPGGTGNSCGFLIWPAGPGGSGSWPIIVAPSSPAMRPSTGRPGSCCTPTVTAAAWCPPMP